jgi:hypothetical protein
MSVHDLRRAIEPLKARARDRALASRRQNQPDPLLLARLESAVAAARSIETTLGELADQLGGLFPYRRLGQGGWVVGVSGIKLRPRPGWRPRLAFTRCEVVVSLSEDGRALEFVCHRSVLDHDLDVLRHSQPLADSEATMEAWLETASLEFAEALLCAREDQSWRPHRATRTGEL